jgi:hypothetical protein
MSLLYVIESILNGKLRKILGFVQFCKYCAQYIWFFTIILKQGNILKPFVCIIWAEDSTHNDAHEGQL